jgi:hypothetical protein
MAAGDGIVHSAAVVVADDGTSPVGSDEWNAKHLIKTLRLSGVISPTALAANTNNYAPTGQDTASVWRLSATTSMRDITGIVAMDDGTVLALINVGSVLIRLRHQNASSTDVNRFAFPGGTHFILPANQAVLIRYDATTQRWLLLDSSPRYVEGGLVQFFPDSAQYGASTDAGATFTGILATAGNSLTIYTGPTGNDVGQTGEYLEATAAGSDWTTPGRDAGNLVMMEAMS